MGRIPIKNGLCGKCNDGILKPCIGQREKALCNYHYKQEHRRSKQGKKDDIIYWQLQKEFLEENPNCIFKFDGCTGKATQVHHARGRGIYYLVVSTFRGGCDHCHRIAEGQPNIAYAAGISEKRLNKY